MKYSIYERLIGHVSHNRWSDAHDLFEAIIRQKVSLRLEEEKELLVEPEEDDEKEVKECGPGCTKPMKEAQGDTDGTEDERDKAAQDEKNAEYAKRKKKDPNYIPGRTVYKEAAKPGGPRSNYPGKFKDTSDPFEYECGNCDKKFKSQSMDPTCPGCKKKDYVAPREGPGSYRKY